jgi:hypothetical protein
LLSTATVILAGGFLFSPFADLMSNAPGSQSASTSLPARRP